MNVVTLEKPTKFVTFHDDYSFDWTVAGWKSHHAPDSVRMTKGNDTIHIFYTASAGEYSWAVVFVNEHYVRAQHGHLEDLGIYEDGHKRLELAINYGIAKVL